VSSCGSAQLPSEVVGCTAAGAAAGAECCVEVDAEGGAEGGAEQNAEQSVSALGMFELLRSVQQGCDEQGLGPEVSLLMAEP